MPEQDAKNKKGVLVCFILFLLIYLASLDLSCSMSGSLTRDRTQVPYIGSMES